VLRFDYFLTIDSSAVRFASIRRWLEWRSIRFET
jgi:hypothetical protein